MPCCWDCIRQLLEGARDTRKTEARFEGVPVLSGGRRAERSEEYRAPSPKNEPRQPQQAHNKRRVEPIDEEEEVRTETIDEEEKSYYSYYSDEQEEEQLRPRPINSQAQIILQSDLVFPESPTRSPIRGIRVNSLQPVYHPDFADWRECVSPVESQPRTPVNTDIIATLEDATASVAHFFISSFRLPRDSPAKAGAA
jgi:hypothetical protein